MLRTGIIRNCSTRPVICRFYSSISEKPDRSHLYADTLCLPKTDFPNRSGNSDQIQALTKRVSDDIYDWQVSQIMLLSHDATLTGFNRLPQNF